MPDLKAFFNHPASPRQRQYEAVRAVVVDQLPVEQVAHRFGYSVATLYSLLRDLKAGTLELFPPPVRGPYERHTPEPVRQLVVKYRHAQLSAAEISARLGEENYNISVRTVERILADAGFPKLQRRSRPQRGRTQRNQQLPERTQALEFETLQPFRIDCPVAGVFFFLPYVVEAGVMDIVRQCDLPTSAVVSAEQAALAMLVLKLIGSERLSHIASYDHEPGLGVFAGLTVLPKASFMTTYSCRLSEALLQEFQQHLLRQLQTVYPQFYQSDFINLDFHTIPHFGTESQMEKVWAGARGKAVKGANTLLAQDAASNVILYTRADILRKDEAREIQHFVQYWKTLRHTVKETLVFDCRLTSYTVLNELMADGVQFITLRRRSQGLLKKAAALPDNVWQRVTLSIPKRKHNTCRVAESEVTLTGCSHPVRQLIITDHGRAQPTVMITNNRALPLATLLEVYAKRWHIENKLAELVSFFNLNALSSPLMIRIHFDILWTLVADTLYHRLAQDLPRFEQQRADSLFRRFIDRPGQISYDGQDFKVTLRKRAHTPILMGVEALQKGVAVPWLDNCIVRYEWTA
jgi:transposase